ncbi:MAG: acyl-CoA carboxylase subunit beta [Eubacteriales bacterium]|nr:acyl-CoA carboxylase subunit beta [Eubacteriales bacterium]
MKNDERILAAIEKQHGKGKLYVTERLEKLFDDGSYSELTTEKERDGVIICEGKIKNKDVIAAVQDFTYRGGTLGLKHGQNIARAQDLAIKKKCPLIVVNDSGGARIQEGIDSLAGYGEIFYRNVRASGYIPQISLIIGPCAGGAVYSPAITDFVFMVKNIGQMYITGPKVVKSVTGRCITAEELGGWQVHARESGVSQFCYEDELSCFDALRYLISILPQNCREKAVIPNKKEYIKERKTEFKLPDSSRLGYDVRQVVHNVMDDDSFMEVSSLYAQSVVIGFAKLYGITVGVVCSQPLCAGGILDCDSSSKAARFIRFCDAFNIPLISFTDVPGYLPGADQEKKGIIRHGAKLLYAFAEADVPKLNVIMRKAYGGAYIAMNSRHLGADHVFSWPMAEIAVMGEDGAVEIIFAKEIRGKTEEERRVFLEEKKAEYRREVINYKHGLEMGYIDAVIQPEETRDKVYEALVDTMKKKKIQRRRRLWKKHGNIPL